MINKYLNFRLSYPCLVLGFIILAFSSHADSSPLLPVLKYVFRYTLTGGSSGSNGELIKNFKVEYGDLYCQKVYDKPIQFMEAAPISASGQTADDLMAINKQVVAFYNVYRVLNRSFDMSCFPHSKEIYSVYDPASEDDPDLASASRYVIIQDAITPSSSKPTVSISTIFPNPTEGGATAGIFLVSINELQPKDTKIRYKISGSAKNGKDYYKLNGMLKIHHGLDAGAIGIAPKADQLVEGLEDVTVTLIPSKNYRIGSSDSATLSIIDAN